MYLYTYTHTEKCSFFISFVIFHHFTSHAFDVVSKDIKVVLSSSSSCKIGLFNELLKVFEFWVSKGNGELIENSITIVEWASKNQTNFLKFKKAFKKLYRIFQYFFSSHLSTTILFLDYFCPPRLLTLVPDVVVLICWRCGYFFVDKLLSEEVLLFLTRTQHIDWWFTSSEGERECKSVGENFVKLNFHGEWVVVMRERECDGEKVKFIKMCQLDDNPSFPLANLSALSQMNCHRSNWMKTNNSFSFTFLFVHRSFSAGWHIKIIFACEESETFCRRGS